MLRQKRTLKDHLLWHWWAFLYVCHKSLALLGLASTFAVSVFIANGKFTLAEHWFYLLGIPALPLGAYAWVTIRREDREIEADIERLKDPREVEKEIARFRPPSDE